MRRLLILGTVVVALAAGAYVLLPMLRCGGGPATVKSHAKISDTAGRFEGELDDHDVFGRSLANIGDLDGDGVTDLAVCAFNDDDGGQDCGAVYVLFLKRDGSVARHRKISRLEGALGIELAPGDRFGTSLAAIDDLDGDGVRELAVSSVGDDRHGEDAGALHVLWLNRDGAVRARKRLDEDGFGGQVKSKARMGTSLAFLGDLDGDGIGDLAVGARHDSDGGRERGSLWVLFLRKDGGVRRHVKISSTQGGFRGGLDDGDHFAHSLACPGDLDGDAVPDLAVGALRDDDGGDNRGAVWLLFLERDGTVKSHAKISDTEGGFEGSLGDKDLFSSGLAGVGDLNGDGVPDLAVGERRADEGGFMPDNNGRAWLLFLNRDGTVKGHREISACLGNFGGELDDWDEFGYSVAPLGDLNADGTPDLAVGAIFDDDGGVNRGAVWILFLDGSTMR